MVREGEGANPVFSMHEEAHRTNWGAEDRRFFREHPERRHRVRRVFAGEFREVHGFDDDDITHVVVRKIGPDVRSRQFLYLDPKKRVEQIQENEARRIFETCFSRYSPGEREGLRRAENHLRALDALRRAAAVDAESRGTGPRCST